jgi:homoprotocatechuate degradation regulator HpaR
MSNARPVSTRRSLPIALLRTREIVMQQFRPHLSELGITEQQWRVLRVLGEDGPSEAGQVAERSCILPPSLTRIIKALELQKLLRSASDKTDGRRTIIALSDKGKKLLAEAAPGSNQIYQSMEKRIGKARLELLLDLLDETQKAISSKP